MGELNHECGVAAIYHAAGPRRFSAGPDRDDVNSVARLIPRMLLDMQNRGQLAAGMTSVQPEAAGALETHKELGTVAEAFRLNHKAKFDAIIKGHDGPAAIGHVRYATCGGTTRATPSRLSAPRPQGQVVRLRLQRPAREFQGIEGRTARARGIITSSATPTPKS